MNRKFLILLVAAFLVLLLPIVIALIYWIAPAT